jgi:uncharacterized membrane protein
MLIGATSGVLIGSLLDIEEADQTESALTAISSSARPGHTTLLAVVREQRREVVDAAMSGLGGTILRRPVYEVEAEIAAVEQAERTAKRKAHKGLLRGPADANHANDVTTSHAPEHEATGMKTDRRKSS